MAAAPATPERPAVAAPPGPGPRTAALVFRAGGQPPRPAARQLIVRKFPTGATPAIPFPTQFQEPGPECRRDGTRESGWWDAGIRD